MQVHTFEELFLSGDLPTPAGVGMRILELTRDDEFSTEDLGQAIMTDSALTGRILKLANSAAHAGEPATTVAESIMRLGSHTVRDLALAFSLVSDRRSDACAAFDYDRYWSKSLARAVVAQELARRVGVGRPEEAYICGLLAEVGQLALASVYPEEYAELLRLHGDAHATLVAAEGERFRIDHSQIGGCLLREWGLPDPLAEAVEAFTLSRTIGDREQDIADLAAVLRFAELLAQICVIDEGSPAPTWLALGQALERFGAALGLERDALVGFCDGCVREWQEWGRSLDVLVGDPIGFASVFERIELVRKGVPQGSGARPVRSPERSRPAPPSDRPGDVSWVRVLAVDDDPVALRVLVAQLEREGYDVTTATDGQSGLMAALRALPDVVVADWQMPGMNGLELCRSLRRTASGRKMFILLLTGTEDEALLVDAFDAGVDDFITKPFRPRIMSARIKGGVRVARLQRKVEQDKQTMMRQVAQLGMLTRKLRATSLTDALTELPNRRYAMKRLDAEWISAERTGRPLSVIMMDIDHFKHVNDSHGHDAGDQVLRRVGEALRASFRQSDDVCRFGGEEFLVVCKNTALEDAHAIAERARAVMEAKRIDEHGFCGSITASFGVASSQQGVGDVTGLLKAADEALYTAKEAGRNRVAVAHPPQSGSALRSA